MASHSKLKISRNIDLPMPMPSSISKKGDRGQGEWDTINRHFFREKHSTLLKYNGHLRRPTKNYAIWKQTTPRKHIFKQPFSQKCFALIKQENSTHIEQGLEHNRITPPIRLCPAQSPRTWWQCRGRWGWARGGRGSGTLLLGTGPGLALMFQAMPVS